MATTYYTDIQKLYVAYFSRPADPAGLAYWETVVEAQGGSTTAVSASFAASAEYTAAYSNMTNAQIITTVYTNLFGHAPDAAGATYWANLLDAKTITMSDAVTAIAGGAQGTDAVAYADKVTAASAFTAAVDTDAEKAGYTGAGNTAAKAWLADVTDATSLAAAIDPAALNTTVAEVVAAGTPFTVAGSLAALDAATTAMATYLKSIDVDGVSTTVTTSADVAAEHDAAILAVSADLDTASGNLFKTDTTSETVRDALISSQQAINASALAVDQKALSDANAAIAKVTGLSAAITTLASANTALTAAQKSDVAAQADLAAKEASFGVTNGGTVHTVTDGDGAMTLVFSASGEDDVVLATISSSTHKATVTPDSATFDSSDYTGLTDVITSFNTEATAAASVTKAGATVSAAQLNVNHLDSSSAEAALLTTVTGDINDFAAAHPGVLTGVTSGTTASEAQITTALTVLASSPAYAADLADLTSDVNAYHTAAATNPLVATLTSATAAVKADNATITDLAKDVAALQTAETHVSTLAGYQATVDADTAVLTAKGYAVVDLSDADGTDALNVIGSASSDIFVVGSQDATISLFGLQGSDSLFIGSGYTLVNGAIGAKGVVGSDTVLEAFLSTDDNGDAMLQIETAVFGSSASTPEVVTIHLVGVDAATLHLDNGIITSGAVTTAAA